MLYVWLCSGQQTRTLNSQGVSRLVIGRGCTIGSQVVASGNLHFTIRKCYLGVIVLKHLAGKHLECWHVPPGFRTKRDCTFLMKQLRWESLHALRLLRASKMLLPSNRARECLQLCACFACKYKFTVMLSALVVPSLAKKISACLF